jgi:hypothetical protein
MTQAHVIIHFLSEPQSVAGGPLDTAKIHQDSEIPQFEVVLAELTGRDDCYCELDGSFAWRGPTADRWQVFGQLHDGRGGLDAMELRGSCPAEVLAAFLDRLGACSMQFQSLPDGKIIDRQATLTLFDTTP